MKKLILTLTILISITACKSDKKNNEIDKTVTEEPKVEVKNEEELVITLNAVVPNDDVFVLQFTQDESFAFKPKDKIKTKIVGSSLAQNISFKLPNDVIPTKFMLKVGRNNTENVIINTVNFNNGEREFKVNKKNFFQFLNGNKFIDYDRENKTYTAKKVDGKFIPTFVSRPLLIERLVETVY